MKQQLKQILSGFKCDGKWVIPNVTVGEEMLAIYYSSDIGNRNDPTNDVGAGTTDLLNKVRITATHDLRESSSANGNYAESGIKVTRGAAGSFVKYSKQTLVEPDGVIDYVLYYDNNSAGEADVVMLDTMPYIGVNGSNFTGSYTVTSWKLNVDKCTPSNFKLYYTTNVDYAGKTINEIPKETIQAWTPATIGVDGTVTAMNGDTPPVAWALIGDLSANEGVYVDLTIKLKPEGINETYNVYHNTFSNSANQTVITTEEHSVLRTLEGLTWIDDNADGVQDSGERHISNVKVSLLKLREGTTFTTNSSGSYDAIILFNDNMLTGIGDASNLKKIRIVASGIPVGQKPELFYKATELNKTYSMTLTSTTTAETEYVYDTSEFTGWSGSIKLLRWDPVDFLYNQSFMLKSITFDLADGSTREFDFTQKNSYSDYLTLYNLSFVKVSDPNNEAEYVPFSYSNGAEAVITTGKKVSVQTGAEQDYELGRYKFTDLPAGTFAVKFEDGTQTISNYIASPANRDGSSDALDSDGIATYSDNRSQLLKTVITGIEMPKAEEMKVVLYESKYHDSGFYERGYELPKSGGAGAEIYTVGGFLMFTSAAFVLLNKEKRRRKS